MTVKLTRESHVKQLMVDSMLCFSFDRPVTDNCPILALKKMYKIEKILPAASRHAALSTALRGPLYLRVNHFGSRSALTQCPNGLEMLSAHAKHPHW